MAIDLKKIQEKFGSNSSVNVGTEEGYEQYREELGENEAYWAMMAARDAGDTNKADQIVKDFQKRRASLAEKYNVAL